MTHSDTHKKPSQQLLPCPFCGSTNVGLHYKYLESKPANFITCQDCIADGPAVVAEIAAAAWNTRVQLPEVREAVEALRYYANRSNYWGCLGLKDDAEVKALRALAQLDALTAIGVTTGEDV